MRDLLKIVGVYAAILAVFGAFVLVTALCTGLLRPWGLEVDRRAVESSRQYAVTNTDAFYTRLEAVRAIDVQIVGASPEKAEALRSQRLLLVNEMRREVAKIPEDARTPDMLLYGQR